MVVLTINARRSLQYGVYRNSVSAVVRVSLCLHSPIFNLQSPIPGSTNTNVLLLRKQLIICIYTIYASRPRDSGAPGFWESARHSLCHRTTSPCVNLSTSQKGSIAVWQLDGCTVLESSTLQKYPTSTRPLSPFPNAQGVCRRSC
jgi:hypothetical protein